MPPMQDQPEPNKNQISNGHDSRNCETETLGCCLKANRLQKRQTYELECERSSSAEAMDDAGTETRRWTSHVETS